MRQSLRSITLKGVWRDPKSGKMWHRSRRGGKLVMTRDGKPRSVKAVVQLFQKCCRELGLPVSIHGLRKTRAVELVEGGATSRQGASWTGHRDLREYDEYAREFDRLRAVTGTAPEPTLDVEEIRLDVECASA